MWEQKDGRLHRQFQFNGFKQAFGFMCQVAEAAEQMDHHPTWTNTYNKVEIWLSTHDAGDQITDKDRQLAAEIDRIYENTQV